jgi:hypothetical protein
MITSYRGIVFYCAKYVLHSLLNVCLNKEHDYRAHINNWDTHAEFAMQTALRSIQTGRDLATRREFSIFNNI